MRTGRGVGERSRRFRRDGETDLERAVRSLDLAGLLRRRDSLSSLSRSALRRDDRSLVANAVDERSLESLCASVLRAELLLTLRERDFRFVARRSLPLLDDDDELELELDDDDELDLEPELRDDELSDELIRQRYGDANANGIK